MQRVDDRFHTPRASASSSRSQASTSSFATARDTLNISLHPSLRDTLNSFRSSDSSEAAPLPPAAESHRRFADHGSRPVPLTTSSHTNDFTRPSTAATSLSTDYTANRTQNGLVNDRAMQKKEPDFNVFSLARHGRVGDVEDALLRGFPIDTTDEFGNNLLIVACQNGNKKIAKLALKYGCNINSVNNTGKTAVNFAKRFGHTDLADYLIDKGADDDMGSSE